jgi:ABC-2 type transport system ATP-binding protein
MSTDHKLTVRVDGPEAEVFKLLEKLPRLIRVDKLGAREGSAFDYTIEAEPGEDVRREMFRRLSERNWPILGLRSSELSLEDIFLQLTDENSSSHLMRDDAAIAEAPAQETAKEGGDAE